MNKALHQLIEGKLFWLLFIALGLFLEGVALYFQHVRGEWPCLLCIQFRILVVLMMIFAAFGLWLKKHYYGKISILSAMLLLFIAMLERSYQLLGVERGWLEGSCSMDLGLPAWLAIDKWFPWLFEVQTSCGYTPEVLFGFTMAELLAIMSVFLVIIALMVLFAVVFVKLEE